jgi:hypothetical protein
MNILYITNFQSNLNKSGFINNYLNDLLYYGFTELETVNIIETIPIICLYKEYQNIIEPYHLWGKGFTSCFLLEHDNKERNSIKNKIQEKYYDLIIYGSCDRCLDGYETISQIYDKSKIVLIDGSDHTDIPPLCDKHILFKRELINQTKQILPIHFAIPDCKITKNPIDKNKMLSNIIPGAKYSYDIENDYYKEYQSSNFAITTKKAGWDCMRHYEILANKCVPIFKDLKNCPKNTLTNLPKQLLIEYEHLIDNFDQNVYNSINDELFEFTKTQLTTKKLANYVLEKVI